MVRCSGSHLGRSLDTGLRMPEAEAVGSPGECKRGSRIPFLGGAIVQKPKDVTCSYIGPGQLT